VSNKSFNPELLGLSDRDMLPRDVETAAHARAKQSRTIGDSVRPVVNSFNDPTLTEEISRRVLDGVSSEGNGIMAKGGASEMTRDGKSVADGDEADPSADSKLERAGKMAHEAAKARERVSYETPDAMAREAIDHLNGFLDSGDYAGQSKIRRLKQAAAAVHHALAAHCAD
jgi:hypothetical protein